MIIYLRIDKPKCKRVFKQIFSKKNPNLALGSVIYSMYIYKPTLTYRSCSRYYTLDIYINLPEPIDLSSRFCTIL